MVPKKPQTSELDTLAQKINEEHNAYKEGFGNALGHAIKAGEALTEAKSKCDHGQWGKWLNDNFEFCEKTAQNYMRVYKERDRLQNRNDVADLSLRGAVAQLTKTKKEPEGSSRSSEQWERVLFNEEKRIAKAIDHVKPTTYVDYFLEQNRDLEELNKLIDWFNELGRELKNRTSKGK